MMCLRPTIAGYCREPTVAESCGKPAAAELFSNSYIRTYVYLLVCMYKYVCTYLAYSSRALLDKSRKE